MNAFSLLHDKHLIDEMKGDEGYRHSYVDEFLNAFIAAQIRALREGRGWSQEKLAKECGMKQSRISLLENVAYSSWSIKTLKKLAEAFDVTLSVKFEGFGKRLIEIGAFSPDELAVAHFDKDQLIHEPDSLAIRLVKGESAGNRPILDSGHTSGHVATQLGETSAIGNVSDSTGDLVPFPATAA